MSECAVIIQHEPSHEQMKSRTLVPSTTRVLVCLVVLALPMPMLMRPSMLAFTVAPPRAATATTLATRLHSVSSLGIVGGGLAGLSTAFHILDKTQGACHVTIYDKSPVGTGGASSVAGGLLHPLSPKGKLVHLGLEGLAASALLVSHSSQFTDCVLRDELYRIATTDQNVDELRRTAALLPTVCEWVDSVAGCRSLGGVKIRGKVLHVPTYLEGLLMKCRTMGTVAWKMNVGAGHDEELLHHDALVYSAGAGLFHDALLDASHHNVPVQLVRGQSLILHHSPTHAVLAGKYMTPLPDPNLCLVGATQEYGDEVWSEEQVRDELATPFLHLWETHPKLDRITCGTRVQSKRSNWGRLPIVGRLDETRYIFTGLSSRGLLYHGLYGDLLTNVILNRPNGAMGEHLDWWR